MIGRILTLLLMMAASGFALEGVALRVTGDAPQALIRSVLRSADSASVVTQIEDSLFAIGCFDASAAMTGDTLRVNCGQRYEVAALRLLGDSLLLMNDEFAGLALRPGVPCESWRIAEAASEVISICEKRGYPFAQVHLDSLALDRTAKSATVHLKLTGGAKVELSFIEFQGNEISHGRLLRRESGLRIGEVYDAERVRQARRRLSQLEYLRRVSEPRLVTNDAGERGLVFGVEESRTSRLDIVAGLSPHVEGNAQTVTGLVDLQFLNLFGTGRRGKVYWRRPASGTQELALAWREVWIAETPLAVDLSFAQRVEDTLYVTRKYGARLSYPAGAGAELFTGVGREELLADSLNAVEIDIVPSSTMVVEAGFVVDTRDHLTNPRGGLRFETSGSSGQRRTEWAPMGSAERDFEQRRAALDFEVNHEPWLYWIFHGSVHARVLYSDEPLIPAPDLYRLGGARSLRGYREEQFLGSRVSWASVEARYWLGPSSRLAVFGDGGVITRESRASSGDVTETTQYKTSYGVGLRLETGVGVWGVDYGIAAGESPLNGQLHVSLLSLF